jgi:hypothetical protein
MSGFEDDTDEEVYIVRRQDSDKLGGTKTERASKKPNEVVKKSSEYDPTHYTSARDHTNIVNESLKYSNNKKNSKTKRKIKINIQAKALKFQSQVIILS